MEYTFLVLGIVAVIVFLFKRKVVVPLSTVVAKGISSLLFIFTALFAFIGNPDCPDYLGAFAVAGACMGMIGDIVLDLKYTYPTDADKYLKTGFISFLIGHVFYYCSLIAAYGAEIENFLHSLCAGLVVFIFVVFSEKIMKIKFGKFKWITAIYMGVVGLTVGLGFSYILSDRNTHTVMFFVAMILFLLSDMLLSGLYFGTREKDKKNQVAITFNHIFYYMAQYLIAASLIFYRG
jgi:uncharacterized membrane protein YhhN